MDKDIPELNHGDGSWFCVSPKGEIREFFKKSNAILAAQHGWMVYPASEYLAKLNQS